MESDQTMAGEKWQNIIRGLLWQDWLRAEPTVCLFFGLWFVLSFLFEFFTHPVTVIVFMTIYAGMIASCCSVGEKEFHFCLPPKRNWQYQTHMLIGLTTTLWLSSASLLTLTLDLPQVIWQYIGSSAFASPFDLADTPWYMFALIVIGPVLSFIYAYVFNTASIQNRFAAHLSGVLSGTVPWIFFWTGISLEWLIRKEGPSFRDGITTGCISIPLMILAGVGLLAYAYYHMRQSDAVTKSETRKKWYLTGVVAVLAMMVCISGIMTWTRFEYQREKLVKKIRINEHAMRRKQMQRVQPILVPTKARRIFKQVCEKGDYPRWQGHKGVRHESSEHEHAGMKFLLILFLIIIPMVAWFVMHRWFSDSHPILAKRLINPLPWKERVKLLATVAIALGVVVWSTVSAVLHQNSQYHEALSQTMLVPTLPAPVPEKPEQENFLKTDNVRFLAHMLLIREQDMHPVFAKTFDIRGSLKDQKPINFEFRYGKYNMKYELKLKQTRWDWPRENVEDQGELCFTVRGKLNGSWLKFVNYGAADFPYRRQFRTIDTIFSLWHGMERLRLITYGIPVSQDDPLKQVTVAQWLPQKQTEIAHMFLQEPGYYDTSGAEPRIFKWMFSCGTKWLGWLILYALFSMIYAFHHHRCLVLPVCMSLIMLLAVGLDAWSVRRHVKIFSDPAADLTDRKCAAMLLDGSFFCDTRAEAAFKRFAKDPKQPDELKLSLYRLTAGRMMNPENDWPVIRDRMEYPTAERAKQLLGWANTSPRRLYIPGETCFIVIREFTEGFRRRMRYQPPVPGKPSVSGLFIYGYSSPDPSGNDSFSHLVPLPKGLEYEQLSWDGRYIHMTFRVRPAYAEKLGISSTQKLTALLTFPEIIGLEYYIHLEAVRHNVSAREELSDIMLNYFVERARPEQPKAEMK